MGQISVEKSGLPGSLLSGNQHHHVSILEMNGASYRLAQSRAKQATPAT
jgi:hypothetical protein